MRFEIKILTIMSFLYGAGAGLLAPIYALYVENIGGNMARAFLFVLYLYCHLSKL